MSKLTIQIIILVTLVVGWTIFMLYQRHQHKKKMRKDKRRRKWERIEEERRDRQWIVDELNQWRRSATGIPYDEFRPKTDKLSPPKKMGKHTMR